MFVIRPSESLNIRLIERNPDEMDRVYRDGQAWNKMSLINIAKSGFFAADRSIHEYAKNIWNLNQMSKLKTK